MSNHDQTKVPTTQAGRGHAEGATAHASPATIKPCRLLRAIHQAPRAGRAQSVSKLSRTVAGLRKIRNRGVSGAGERPGLAVNAGTFLR